MKTMLVTGGAGFIGSHLCDALLEKGCFVVCVDNLQRGEMANIAHLKDQERFVFLRVDVSDKQALEPVFQKYSFDGVYHLAANTDLWESMHNPAIEHVCTFETTRVLLEVMTRAKVKDLFFASTSAIYGEQSGENGFVESDPLKPISYYGAAKMAAEAYIQAFAYMNDMNVLVYRFSNIIGQRMTHGVIRDFTERLLQDPSHLDVRGNGYQKKPYCHVSELIRAIVMKESFDAGVHIFNVGATTCTNVRFIAKAVTRELGLENIPIHYEDRSGGWKGDVAHYTYNVEKIRETGWDSQMDSDEAVLRSVAEIVQDCKRRQRLVLT